MRERPGDVLWFPTSAGLASVDPSKVFKNTIPPEVHFRTPEVNGIPRPVEAGPLVVGPGRAGLAFHFSGISLGAPEKVTYQVQLVGLDESRQLIGS